MDIAGMASVLKHQQVKLDASMAVMNQSKQFTENMGEQLIEMIEKSAPIHPTLGKHVDLKG